MKNIQVDLESDAFDLAVHRNINMFSVCNIDGKILCYSYGDDLSCTLQLSIDAHKVSCRSIDYSKDGNYIFSASKDKSVSVFQAETGSLIYSERNGHSSPVNIIKVLDEKLIASGDDSGVVKLWDISQRKCIRTYNENTDYISDIDYDDSSKTLLVSSGDGCLSVFDITRNKPIAVSENQDDELLSVAIVKNNRKVIVGTQEGVLEIFSWGNWGDCTDRYPGIGGSIDSMIKYDENQIITASNDGKISVVSILPNEIVETLADYEEEIHIESIKLDRTSRFLFSCAHDQTIRIWDLNGQNSNKNTDPDAELYQKKPSKKRRHNSGHPNNSDFFADL